MSRLTIGASCFCGVLLGFALTLTGCDDPKPTPTATSATAAATTTSSAAPKKQLPKPKPLDVKAMQSALKCGGMGHGPCEVLEEFSSCEKWNPVTQSGDGRWLGESSIVKDGKFVSDLVIMRSKRVPLAEVGPGQLPAKIGVVKIDDSLTVEREHAKKAIRAFKRGDVTKRNINKAITYIKQRKDWPEAFSIESDQNQVYAAVGAGAYFCAKKDQRLLVVKLSGNREHKADGTYATLYPVQW